MENVNAAVSKSASFTRGTTPDYSFKISQDISDWEVYLTFGQKGRELVTIKNPDVTPSNGGGCLITGRLTQKDTLKFKKGEGEAQVRCYKNGVAAANPIKFKFEVFDIIMDGVIPKAVKQ